MWGRNHRGQLGRPSQEFHENIETVDLPGAASRIELGGAHSAANVGMLYFALQMRGSGLCSISGKLHWLMATPHHHHHRVQGPRCSVFHLSVMDAGVILEADNQRRSIAKHPRGRQFWNEGMGYGVLSCHNVLTCLVT